MLTWRTWPAMMSAVFTGRSDRSRAAAARVRCTACCEPRGPRAQGTFGKRECRDTALVDNFGSLALCFRASVVVAFAGWVVLRLFGVTFVNPGGIGVNRRGCGNVARRGFLSHRQEKPPAFILFCFIVLLLC